MNDTVSAGVIQNSIWERMATASRIYEELLVAFEEEPTSELEAMINAAEDVLVAIDAR